MPDLDELELRLVLAAERIATALERLAFPYGSLTNPFTFIPTPTPTPPLYTAPLQPNWNPTCGIQTANGPGLAMNSGTGDLKD